MGKNLGDLLGDFTEFFKSFLFKLKVCSSLANNLSSCSEMTFLSKGLRQDASINVMFDCLDEEVEGIDEIS